MSSPSDPYKPRKRGWHYLQPALLVLNYFLRYTLLILRPPLAPASCKALMSSSWWDKLKCRKTWLSKRQAAPHTKNPSIWEIHHRMFGIPIRAGDMFYSVRKAQVGIRRSGTVVESRQVGKADQRGTIADRQISSSRGHMPFLVRHSLKGGCIAFKKIELLFLHAEKIFFQKICYMEAWNFPVGLCEYRRQPCGHIVHYYELPDELLASRTKTWVWQLLVSCCLLVLVGFLTMHHKPQNVRERRTLDGLCRIYGPY